MQKSLKSAILHEVARTISSVGEHLLDVQRVVSSILTSSKGHSETSAFFIMKERTTDCPIAYKCGGCIYSDVPYETELREKTDYVFSLFGDLCPVYRIKGMDDPYRYRDKVQAVFGTDRTRRTISGLYIRGTHHLIEVRDCLLEFKEASSILLAVRRLMKSYGLHSYDEDEMRGDIRHVLLRKGHNSGEILCTLIFGNDNFKRKKEFANALHAMCPEITTILFQVNGEKTSMVLSSGRIHTLYGKGYIEDTLSGLRFRISASSFYQINSRQTEVLYDMALLMADLKGNERVLDAYSGTGTITLLAARKARSAVGVELNEEAVRNATENMMLNNIGNARFIQADASAYCKQMAKEKEKFDVAFLDPPRSGSDERFLSSLIRLSPEKIVYISCNPETQRRDVDYLEKFGPYRTTAIQPVDMFPRTEHVETVVLLSKG